MLEQHRARLPPRQRCACRGTIAEGFEGSGDAALDIDEAILTGVTVTIVGNSVRSPGFDHTDIDQYIDIPAGWDNSGVNANVFYIKDEATGQVTTVSDGAAH
jgi:hypothetical protein